MSLAAKYTLSGKVVQADNVGKHGEGFAAIYELNGTASGKGPDHKLRCFGTMHGAMGTIAGEHGYCVETDPDGDQVLWKMTPAPHSAGAMTDLQGVWEALLGTGKYTRISMATGLRCQQSQTGLVGFKLECDVSQ
jgi:hypothetical protein